MAIEPNAELCSVVPILPVSDMPAALAWYEHVLAFRLAWKWGDPPQVACVCRDRVELMLERFAGDGRPGIARLYLQVNGADRYYREIVAAGANVTHPLATRAYGMKDGRVVDPDGNELSFGERARPDAVPGSFGLDPVAPSGLLRDCGRGSRRADASWQVVSTVRAIRHAAFLHRGP